MILVAYAWLSIAQPMPVCLIREVWERMPGRCVVWSKP